MEPLAGLEGSKVEMKSKTIILLSSMNVDSVDSLLELSLAFQSFGPKSILNPFFFFNLITETHFCTCPLVFLVALPALSNAEAPCHIHQ